MRFALVNNERVEAAPEFKGVGICSGCSQPVTARCGDVRVHHWAHKGERKCDKWWESETEWHRAWKDKFPKEWQEVRRQDPLSGEWHIADVRTQHDLVIEFQHSHLKPQERAIREKFYGNMIWIVDGRKKDFLRFQAGMSRYARRVRDGYFVVDRVDQCFPTDWLESSVEVIFDFQGVETSNVSDVPLWCLIPKQKGKPDVVVCLSRDKFVEIVRIRGKLFP